MLKSPDPDFCPFAKTQSWGHIEALWGPRSPKTSLQQHFSWVHYGSDTLYNIIKINISHTPQCNVSHIHQFCDLQFTQAVALALGRGARSAHKF